MKKLAPHLSNKRGSMLMLTLIVFMVILILGMTMITSMLYSQGENNMQINEQKAYYAAFSAVEAVKSYFLNPELNVSKDSSITSPHDLIGGEYTYNLTEKGMDENTTVSIQIRNGGNVPNESSKNYIIIEATGMCGGEKSTITARMIEEEKKGSTAGVYSSQAVFASNGLTRNSKNYDLQVKGNIFVNDADMYTGINIHSIDLTKTNEINQGGNLFIYSKKSSARVQNNKLRNVFFQSESDAGMDINNNRQIDNIYFQQLYQSNTNVNFHGNKVIGEAQFLTNSKCPSILDNEIGIGLILSVPTVHDGAIQNNKVDDIFIHGAKNISKIESEKIKYTIRTLHTDAISCSFQPYVTNIVKEDLSSLIWNCEQQIRNVMKGIKQMSDVLESKPPWTRPDAESGFIELKPGEGEYAQDSINKKFKEYYDPYRKIRLIFANDQTYTVLTKKSPPSYLLPDYNNDTYFISNNTKYAEDQIFFIAEKATTVKFSTSLGDKFDALYVYAPKAECQFNDDFDYLKGSIIAKNIIIDAPNQSELIFREPKNIDGIGIPGDTESTDSSSGTTYTYHFEEYIESDTK